MTKAKAKLKKELHALQKEARQFAASLSSKTPSKEAQAEEGRNAKESLPLDPEIEQAALDFEREMLEEEMIDKAIVEFDEKLQIKEDVALAVRLNTPVGLRGRKRRKRRNLGTTCLERKRNTSPRRKRKRKEKRVDAANPLPLHLRNSRARNRRLRHHHKWPSAIRRLLIRYLPRPKEKQR